MVRSDRDDVFALREALMERSNGRCEWPECPSWGTDMAHLIGRGMGGSAERDRIDNVALLCRFHHDLLDGRSHHQLRREILKLLRVGMGLR